MRVTALAHPAPARTGAVMLALTLTAILTTLAPLGAGTAAAATSRATATARHSAGATFSRVRASRADRLNWKALARCEAGGNPRAANPAGYYGLYQFTVATWRGVGGPRLPEPRQPG